MSTESPPKTGANEVALPALVRFERYPWLMSWVQQYGRADVLDSDFVDAYIAATNARHKLTCWGAYKCPMLGRDLAHMAKCGALKRYRIGMAGAWQPGFPKWVWSYEPGHASYLYQPNASAVAPATLDSASPNDVMAG